MESPRTLEIVRTRAGNHSFCFLWILICLYTVSLPFIALIDFNRFEFSGRRQEAHKLLHDIISLNPQLIPFPGMWRDCHPFQNGSSYVPFDFTNEGMFVSFIIFSPWMQQIAALVQMVSFLLQFLCLQLWLVIIRLKKRKLVLFLFLITVFSCLLVAAMDVPVMITCTVVRDYFLTWIESHIVEEDLDTNFYDELFSHPFTQGREAPFFLTKLARYHGEDVVLVCNYKVYGNADVEPYPIKTWWRKNGVPVEENDRMHVNVSIESIVVEIPVIQIFQQYHIRSKLIIEFFQPDDIGIYTCDYVNPMPQLVRMEPYSQQNDPTYVKAKRSEPMSPDSKCNCQPTFNEKHMHLLPRPPTVCFTEFVLKARPKETKIVKVHPGGILFSLATYSTVVSVDDIKVDVATEEALDDKGNYGCCSFFIKIYWQLFQFGGFNDYPVSSLLAQNNENLANELTVCKFKCICRHSSKLQEFTFYRNYFNSTTKEQEDIEIKHPVTLFLQPEDGGSIPLFEILSFCNSSNSDQWLCWCLEKLLFNSFYTFYNYDILMFITMLMVLIIMKKFVALSAFFIAKPLRKFCFVSNSQRVSQFSAVNGSPLYLHSQETMTSYDNDVYLSYSEDDEYDSKVAIYLKELFQKVHMTVFDSVNDILPGRLVAYESTRSIQHSGLFVIIVSKSYTEDNMKKMEFVAIQDTIVRRGSVPKDCILIVQVEDCDIVGLHNVPCIRVPKGMKEGFSLDQSSVYKLYEWICTNLPINTNKTALGKAMTRVHVSGFTIMSAIFLLLLVYLASKSSVATLWPASLLAGLPFVRVRDEPGI